MGYDGLIDLIQKQVIDQYKKLWYFFNYMY